MTTMTIGIALQIGVSFVDSGKYPLHIPPLPSAELDALSITRLVSKQGFWAKLLLNADATPYMAMDAVRGAARLLQPGDIFMLYFAGHGTTVPAGNNAIEDAWLLYDRPVTRSEVRSLMTGFREGVRILIISDSCNSGGIVSKEILATPNSGSPEDSSKALVENKSQDEINATLVLLASSPPNENSGTTPKHGFFTQKLLSVWDDGAFEGTYLDFYRAIEKKLMELQQQPVFQVYGGLNPSFTSQKPFTI
jgi:hypothetical protein